jgi:hypothetical protein
MGIGGAVRALMKFRQRQRRAKLKASRLLLLRDGDGREQGFFRRRGIHGVTRQQHFAARAMQFRFERAIARAIRSRKRFVEDGDGAVGIARPRLGLGQPRSSRARGNSGGLAGAGPRRRGACR